MADDRPADTSIEALGKLQKDFEDFKATVSANLMRPPTGLISATMLASAPQGALLLNGQTVSRTIYSVLWAWVNANSLIGAGKFTVGDNSTTFGLPNFQGRVLVGAGALTTYSYVVGGTFGTERHTILHDQMPTHSHATSNASHEHAASGGHMHWISNPRYLGVTQAHDHGSGPGKVAEGARPESGAAAGMPVDSVGHHTHGFNGSHNHGSTTQAGQGDPFDAFQPSIVVNWLIWT